MSRSHRRQASLLPHGPSPLSRSSYRDRSNSPPPFGKRRARRGWLSTVWRWRVHPFALVVVLLVGAWWSPFKGSHTNALHPRSTREDTLPESKVGGHASEKHPVEYGDEPLDEFVDEVQHREPGQIINVIDGQVHRVQPVGGPRKDGDLEQGDQDDSDSAAVAATRPSYFVERDGYLYFPTSVPIVHVEVPKARHKTLDEAHEDELADNSLAGAFPPVPVWPAPGSRFRKPEAATQQQNQRTQLDLAGSRPLLQQQPVVAEGGRLRKNAGLLRDERMQKGARVKEQSGNSRVKVERPRRIQKGSQQHSDEEEREVGDREAHLQGHDHAKDDEELDRSARQGLLTDEEAVEDEDPDAPVEPLEGGVEDGDEADLEPVDPINDDNEGVEPDWGDAGPPDVLDFDDEDDNADDDDDGEWSLLGGHEPGPDSEIAALLEEFRSLRDDQMQSLTSEEIQMIAEAEAVEAELVLRRQQSRNQLQAGGGKKPMQARPRVLRSKKRTQKLKAALERVSGWSDRRHELRKRDLLVDEPVEESVKSPPRLVRRDSALERPSTNARLQHPIAFLMSEARRKWRAMLKRQSQTLGQAVAEYKRRYNRPPPLGFDKWWQFAMEHKVMLVDEYDQIDQDITPFLALPAEEARLRAAALTDDDNLPFKAESFSVSIAGGSVKSSGAHAKTILAEDMLDIIGEFAPLMPDLKVTFAASNEPMVPVTSELRDAHVELARAGKIMDAQQARLTRRKGGLTDLQRMCSANSTVRRTVSGQVVDNMSSAASVVSTDHQPAMDFCQHPELQTAHGFTSSTGPEPYLLYPLISWSKTPGYGDLLVPPLEGFFDDVGRDPRWEQKRQNKVLWRGKSTGMFHSVDTAWRSSQRARLVNMANNADGEKDMFYTDPASSLRKFHADARDAAAFYLDVAYEGVPTQCDVQDGTCEAMKRRFRFEPRLTKEQENAFKFVLDVDDNTVSGDFRRKMLSNSAVLKSTIFPEWWTKRIVPWFHYIPIKNDYSDLLDVAAFFIGAPDGSGQHDELAKEIADNGKKWASECWREVDIAAYHFRLYLELNRVLHRHEPGSHDYIS